MFNPAILAQNRSSSKSSSGDDSAKKVDPKVSNPEEVIDPDIQSFGLSDENDSSQFDESGDSIDNSLESEGGDSLAQETNLDLPLPNSDEIDSPIDQKPSNVENIQDDIDSSSESASREGSDSVPAQTSISSGAGINMSKEVERLLERINTTANIPSDLKEKALAMVYRLQHVALDGGYSKEYEPVAEYVQWITQIPWGVHSEDNLEMLQVKEELTKHHYGLEPVKQRLMEYLAIMKLKSSTGSSNLAQQTGGSITTDMSKLKGSTDNAPVLCFVGIQGVGKTSMAKSIANALNRKFVRISLGAVGSVTEIRGRSRGEIDAEPGQVIKALIRSKSMNPVILLDEIDKTSSATGLRADIMAALLEILDPEQNATFIDKYIDYPVDLSKVFFITTANNLGGISAALLDRLEIIRFGSYTDSDKIQIAKNYLLPKVRKATGLTETQFSFDDDVWPMVVRPLGFDAGVRQLERTLADLARKVALQLVQGTRDSVRITKENFREFIPEDFGVYS